MEDAPASAALIPIRLERREPARNRQRFHAITVTRTRFDGWALVREWGRIGRPGRGQGGRGQTHRRRSPSGGPFKAVEKT